MDRGRKTLIVLTSAVFCTVVCSVRVAASDDPSQRIQIHGSVSQGYLLTDENSWMGETEDGSFDFNEFAVNLSANLTDDLRVGVQLMSRDIGSFANNEVRLDWAIIDYSWFNQQGVRIGLIRLPQGLYGESRDVDRARIGVLLPQGYYSENTREIAENLYGMSFYGALDLKTAGSIDYVAVIGSKELDENGELASLAQARGYIDTGSVMYAKMTDTLSVGVNWRTPVSGLRLNTHYAEYDLELSGSKTIPGLGPLPGMLRITQARFRSVGVEYSLLDLILASEYYENETPSEFLISGNAVGGSTVDGQGWYLSASYRFNDWFATEVSYSEKYPDKQDQEGARFSGAPGDERFYAWQDIWSVNTRFDINRYWTFKAAVNFNDGMALANNYQNLEGARQNWVLFQLKTTVTF